MLSSQDVCDYMPCVWVGKSAIVYALEIPLINQVMDLARSVLCGFVAFYLCYLCSSIALSNIISISIGVSLISLFMRIIEQGMYCYLVSSIKSYKN